MKDALKRYLLGMNSALCWGAILLTAGMLALNWHYRALWMSLDLAPTPMGWVLEQHPTWKFGLLAGIPTVVGLLVIWGAVTLLISAARTIRGSDRPWTALYGTTFFFILVQVLCLGWAAFVLLAWPPTEPPRPVASPSPEASPSPSASPSASPSPGQNPFGLAPSGSPSPAVADPFRPSQPSRPLPGLGSGRYVEFFDCLTLTVEKEVDLGRASTPRQFGCRDGLLFWADGEHLTAVDLSTGSTRWRVDSEGEDEVAATVGELVLTRAKTRTLARRASDGELLWQTEKPWLVDGDRLYRAEASARGQVKALQPLDLETGQGQGEPVQLKRAVEEPQIDGGVIVGRATEPNRVLPVQDVATGELLWASNDVGDFLARNGRLFVSVEEGTHLRELRTGKPLMGNRALPGAVVASFPGSIVMNDPVKAEYAAYDPGTGAAQWGWQGVRAWKLSGRDGMLVLANEGGALVLLAYDGKGTQLFKGPLDPELSLRAVLGAGENRVVLLVDKLAPSPSPSP